MRHSKKAAAKEKAVRGDADDIYGFVGLKIVRLCLTVYSPL